MKNISLRITVTAAGLVLAFVHIRWREARIDSIAVALLVVAAVPWLSPLIKTVEVPGLKLELQELKDKLNEAKVEAADAKGAAESASLKAAFGRPHLPSPHRVHRLPASPSRLRRARTTWRASRRWHRSTRISAKRRLQAIHGLAP